MKSTLSGVLSDECQGSEVDGNVVSLLQQDSMKKSFSTEKTTKKVSELEQDSTKKSFSSEKMTEKVSGKVTSSSAALSGLLGATSLGVAGRPPVVSQVGLGILLCLVIIMAYSQFASAASSGSGMLDRMIPTGMDKEEVVSVPPSPVQEDTYGFAVASLVRDSQKIARGEGAFALRSSRMLAALVLLYVTIFCQVGLVLQVKWYVTPQQVSMIRNDYSTFEKWMYDGHTTLTVNGKHRGIDGYFQPENFEAFDPELKTNVCSIPFSQLSFLMLVLFIWSLTCAAQIKTGLEFLFCLLFTVANASSMSECLGDDDQDPSDAEQEHIIRSLTWPMKLWIAVTILLPWLFVTIYLCFLGCRWLAATNDFGALVSNAVALEFILLLKDLFYNALVPERCKRDVQKTMLIPNMEQEQAGWMVFFGSFTWGVFTLCWVLAYIFHVQAVLPEYRWDVHDTCAKYLLEMQR
eukprot:CAMPEP_0170604390 /NCGR_PEP_ID=MMETSP0224-20130122/19396_1 /TAXON_ID=285029 /ORGANISM="Togula jolla, Strain CCCM 725" /LENGTH=462 /DNA_ID=CAMNT_0010929287 /DNA_START=179 /DNA_END=1567 /DNA_ORIENTATION=+